MRRTPCGYTVSIYADGRELLVFRTFLAVSQRAENPHLLFLIGGGIICYTNYTKEGFAMQFPKGKTLAMVKVGPKGQIVIPADVREMFGIRSGDSLLLLADIERGIALPPKEQADILLGQIMKEGMT